MSTPYVPLKFKTAIKLSAAAFFGFTAYGSFKIYKGDENFYNNRVIPAFMSLDPENSHRLAIKCLHYELVPSSKYIDTPLLAQKIKHITFRNPIGMAAGFDKNADAVKGLDKIGFGFVEVGSVTPYPQNGNDRPRIFRVPEINAIINRCGFNSDGHEQVYYKLKRIREKNQLNCVLGVNLGKNKVSDDPVRDYTRGIHIFADVADYFAINVSSPNTPGLRDLQKKEHLKELLSAVIAARNEVDVNPKPLVFLKLSPDLTDSDRKDIANVIKDKKCAVDGLIISNTTVEKTPFMAKYDYGKEAGGLSGEPLKNESTKLISDMYKLTKGSIPIIGVGGVFTGQDALEKLAAGASLIQIYTSFVYKGPPVVANIKKELYSLIKENGYGNIQEAVGKKSKQ